MTYQFSPKDALKYKHIDGYIEHTQDGGEFILSKVTLVARKHLPLKILNKFNEDPSLMSSTQEKIRALEISLQRNNLSIILYANLFPYEYVTKETKAGKVVRKPSSGTRGSVSATFTTNCPPDETLIARLDMTLDRLISLIKGSIPPEE